MTSAPPTLGNLPEASAIGSIREFFGLRRAEETVAAYRPAALERVQAHAVAAARRLAAGRRTLDDLAAAVLLRDAIRLYLHAWEAAHEGTHPGAGPAHDERVQAALSAEDPLVFDRLPREELALTRVALEQAAAALAGKVEARSLLNLRATRWGRRAAVGLLALYVLGSVAAALFLPKNVALEKPVHPSSSRHGDGHELVDGEVATVPGILTNVEEAPSVVIDLVDTYAVDEIRVRNRIDQAFDDSLPLVVEVSADGATFKPLGRRDEHFAAEPPWVIKVHREPARLVRIKVMKRGYLALSEVEVYGKKLEPKAAHP
jgi:hypothetical protein